ncbi:MAG: hypothetical protein E7607_00205 [Ruminococcaceae bacterium]|nr:hypothetical protein [Oscillospiraceae bacterium]
MKKIISIALVIVMIVLAVPFSAFAAVKSEPAAGDKITTGVATVVYTKDGSETELGTFDTIDAAVEKLQELYVRPLVSPTVTTAEEMYVAAGSPVIKLNGNFDGATVSPDWVLKNYFPNKHITVVIDGAKSATENYTISCGGITLFDHLAFYNLTVKNTNITFTNPAGDNNIRWNGNIDTGKANGRIPAESFTIFENCVIDQNSTQNPGTESGGLFKMNGFQKAASGVDAVTSDKFNLTLKDCTISSATAVGLQVHWGADANVTLENTTWTLDGPVGTNNNNDCMLKAYESGNISFNIDGNSKLIAARSEGAKTVALIRTLNTVGGNVTVNLDAGAELIMNNTATTTLTRQSYISIADIGHKTEVNDKGAVYKANADSQKMGNIALPTCFTDEVGTAHVWKVNGAVVDSVYKNADATADVVFVHEKGAEKTYEETPDSIAYIEISSGSKFYFTTLSEAVDHVGVLFNNVKVNNITDEALWQAAGSPVIYLYKDIELTSTIEPSWWNKNYDANRVRTVIIKGLKSDNTQVNITSSVAGAAFRYNAYYNLTLENINLNCTAGFAIFWSGYNGGRNSGKSTTTLKDCYIKATGTTGEGLVFKVTGNQKTESKTEDYIINLINTDVMAIAGSGTELADSDGVNAVFLFHHGCAGTLNIDGESTIKHYNKRNTAGGDTIFMLGTNRKFVINIESGAELLGRAMNVASTGTYANTYAIFRLEGSDNYPSADGIKNVINIKSGAKITLDTNGTLFTGRTFFFWNDLADTSKSIYNIDPEADLVFTAKAAALGGGLIGGTADYCGGTAVGFIFKSGEVEDFAPGAIFVADKYTQEVRITPVVITNDSFRVAAGAAVMMHEGKGAIRFQSNVSKELLEILNGCELTFGTVVVVKSALADFAPIPELVYGKPVGINLISTQSKWIETEDVYVYYSTIAGIDATAENFITELAFRSYMKVKYADGTVKTYYTEYDEALHERSMYEVASKLEAANKGTEATKTIVDTVNEATK